MGNSDSAYPPPKVLIHLPLLVLNPIVSRIQLTHLWNTDFRADDMAQDAWGLPLGNGNLSSGSESM